jgi:HSP20 family protein
MSALTKWNPFRTASELESLSPLAPFNPFHEMERMQRDLDRMFNGWRGLVPHPEEAMTITEWSPAVDIIEDEREFIVKTELPDVKKDDVKVTVERDTLTVRGERKAEKEEKGKKYHRIERSYGSFERSFTLPEGTDPTKIRSEYKDGLLTVHLPKSPEAKAKSKAIEVKVE